MNVYEALTADELQVQTNAQQTLNIYIQNHRSEEYDSSVEHAARTKISNHERQTRQIFMDACETQRKNLTSLRVGELKDNISNAEEISIPPKKMEISKLKQELSDCQRAKEKALSQLSLFRINNKLGRHAIFPEDRMKVWVFLLIGWLFEGLFNSLFFAIASEYGIAGGFIMALLISTINITLAIFSAHYFRNLNHIDFPKKLVGGILCSLFLSVDVFLAFFVGHYRSALSMFPVGKAEIEAVNMMSDGPFNVGSFNSWILVIIGIVVFIVAAYKWYRNDDVYPQYGEISRKALEAEQDLSDKSNSYSDEVAEIREELLSEFDNHREELNQLTHKLDESISVLKSHHSHFKSFLAQQGDEFQLFCSQVRGFFASELKQLTDKKAIIPKGANRLTFEKLDEQQLSDDRSKYEGIKNNVETFLETEVPGIRKSFIYNINNI